MTGSLFHRVFFGESSASDRFKMMVIITLLLGSACAICLLDPPEVETTTVSPTSTVVDVEAGQ